MNCEFQTLSESLHGKVIRCINCEHKVALLFNNITQCFSIGDFHSLKDTLEQLNPERFFKLYPNEKRIHMQTEFKTLYFSFTKEEIYELRDLFSKADIKLHLYEILNGNLN